jgi:DNA excision repair protein ERCC-2
VAACIHAAVRHKQGNYMVYCASYSYMQHILREFEEYGLNYDILVQSQAMEEEEREAFLRSFRPDNPKTLVGFAVMGGIFSEGIDLRGDRLSGVVIVGVGLPLLCLERDVIKAHFDEEKGCGFDYAYKFPGMNKVQQAAGRVIRSETDRGIVVLIDERFDQMGYRRLFPKEWEGAVALKGPKELEHHMISFWEHNKFSI